MLGEGRLAQRGYAHSSALPVYLEYVSVRPQQAMVRSSSQRLNKSMEANDPTLSQRMPITIAAKL